MAINIDVNLRTRASATTVSNLVKALERADTVAEKHIKSLGRVADAWDAILGKVEAYRSAIGAIRPSVPTSFRGGGASSSRAGGGGTGGGGTTGGARSGGGGGRNGFRAATPMDEFRLWDKADRLRPGTFAQQRADALQKAVAFAQSRVAAGDARGFSDLAYLMGAADPQAPPKGPKASPTPRTPKGPPTVGSALRNAVMSTRVGFSRSGVEVAPLIGRTIAALAGAGPAGMAAAAALGVLAGAAVGVATTMDNLASKARTQAAVGVVGSSMLGRAAAGLGLGSAADLAMRIQGGIESGAGAGYAGSLGINTVGGPFGDMAYASKAMKVLADIARSGSFEEARRKAAMVGTPEAASAFYLSGSQKEYLARGRSSPLDTGAGVRGNFELERAKANLAEHRDLLMVGMLTALTPMMERANAFLEGLNNWLGKDSGDSQRENTKAMRENTRELQKAREIFNGGRQAGGALPGKIDGKNLGEGARRHLDGGFPL